MRVVLAFTACVLIWGSTWYAIELQLGVVPKEWSLVYRFGIASASLFIICLLRRERLKLRPDQHVWTALTGLFLFSGTYVLTYSGSEQLTSGLVAISFSLLSFLNLINGRIFLGNSISFAALLAALMGISGLALLFRPEIEAFSFDDQTIQGLTFCFAATLVCSFGNTAAAATGARKIPLLTFNAFALGFGGLFNLIYALLSNQPISFDWSPSYVGSLLYLAVIGTVVAFSIYIWLIDRIGIGRAAYMSVLTPMIALTISTFFEGFTWSTDAMVGVALALTGNLLLVLSKPKPRDG